MCNCVIRYVKVPIVIPGLMLVVSCYLVLAPIIEEPQIEHLYCTIFIFSGLLFYYPFIYRKVDWARRLMSKFILISFIEMFFSII